MENYNLHEKTTYYINIKYVHKENKLKKIDIISTMEPTP